MVSNCSNIRFVGLLLYLVICIFSVLGMQITYGRRVHRNEFMQEGFARLWRGTNASLALAVPTVSSLFCWEFSVSVLYGLPTS